jgi:hypothetical protein
MVVDDLLDGVTENCNPEVVCSTSSLHCESELVVASRTS